MKIRKIKVKAIASEAARRYNEATKEFVESGKVEDMVEAGKVSEAEKKELEQAEQAAKDRAREVDPAVKRDYSQKG